MRTVQVAKTAVSIWFSQEDVPDRRQMLRIVRNALEANGLEPWPEAEAECFAAGEDTLVIARPAPERQKGFFFPDLESLLSGALACPPALSSLYDDGAGFLLAVAPEGVCSALYEFGRPADISPDWETHAREQGLCLRDGDALAELLRCFSPEYDVC